MDDSGSCGLSGVFTNSRSGCASEVFNKRRKNQVPTRAVLLDRHVGLSANKVLQNPTILLHWVDGTVVGADHRLVGRFVAHLGTPRTIRRATESLSTSAALC